MAAAEAEVGPAGFARSDIAAFRRHVRSRSRANGSQPWHSPKSTHVRTPSGPASEAAQALTDAVEATIMPSSIDSMKSQVEQLHEQEQAPEAARRMPAAKEPPQLALDPAQPDPRLVQLERGAVPDDIEIEIDGVAVPVSPTGAAPKTDARGDARRPLDAFEPFDRHLAELALPASRACIPAFTGLLHDKEPFEAVSAARLALRTCRLANSTDAAPVRTVSEAVLCAGEGLARCAEVLTAITASTPLEDAVGDARLGSLSFTSIESATKWRKHAIERYEEALASLHSAVRSPTSSSRGKTSTSTSTSVSPSGVSTGGDNRRSSGGWCCCFGGKEEEHPPAERRGIAPGHSTSHMPASKHGRPESSMPDSDMDGVDPASDTSVSEVELGLHATAMQLERLLLQATNPGILIPGTPKATLTSGVTGLRDAVAASRPESQLRGNASTIVNPLRAATNASSESAATSVDSVISFDDLMSQAPSAAAASGAAASGAAAGGSSRGGSSESDTQHGSGEDIIRPASLWRPLMRPSRSAGQEALAMAFVMHYGLDPVTPYVARAEALAARLPLALHSVQTGHTPPGDVLVMIQETGSALKLATGILYQDCTDDDGIAFAPALVQRTMVVALLTTERAVHGVVGCLVQWALLLQGRPGGGRVLYQCLQLWRELVEVRTELIQMRMMASSAGRTYRGVEEEPAQEAAQCTVMPAEHSPGRAAPQQRERVPGLNELSRVLYLSMRRHWMATGEMFSTRLEQAGRRSGGAEAEAGQGVAAEGLETTLSRLQAGVKAVDVFVGGVGEAIASWSLDVMLAEQLQQETLGDDQVAVGSALRPLPPALPVPEGGVDSAWASTVLARQLSNAALVETKVALHMLPPHKAPLSPGVFGVGVAVDTGTAVVKTGALAVGVFGVFVRILRLFKKAGADLHGTLAALGQIDDDHTIMDASAIASGFAECPVSRTIGARLTDEQLEASVLEMQKLFQPYVRAWITVRRRVVEQDTLARALREGLRTALASLRPEANIMHSAVAGLLFQFSQYTIGELRALPALLSPEDVSRAGVMLLTWPVAALARRCTAAAMLCLSDDAHGTDRSAAHRSTSWLLARRDAAWLMADAVATSDRFGAAAGARGAAGIASAGTTGKLPFGSASDICKAALTELRAQDAATMLSPARHGQMELLEKAPWPAKPAVWHASFSRFFQLTPLSEAQRVESEEMLRRVIVLLNDAMYCHQAISQVLSALDNLRVAEPWTELEAVDMELQESESAVSGNGFDDVLESDMGVTASSDTVKDHTGAERLQMELQESAACGGEAGRSALVLLEHQRCIMRSFDPALAVSKPRKEGIERGGIDTVIVDTTSQTADAHAAAAEEQGMLNAAAKQLMEAMDADDNDSEAGSPAVAAAAAGNAATSGQSDQDLSQFGAIPPSPWTSASGGAHSRMRLDRGSAGSSTQEVDIDTTPVRIGPLPAAVTHRAGVVNDAKNTIRRVEPATQSTSYTEPVTAHDDHVETPVGLSAAIPTSMLREESRTRGPVMRARLTSSTEVRALRLRVAVQRAVDVPWMDARGFSKSDPYVSITLAPSHGELVDGTVMASQLTGVIENSASPVWNEKFVLTTALGQDPWVRFSMHDWDDDESEPDDFVGSVSLPLAPLLNQGAHAITAWLRPDTSAPKTYGTVDAALPIKPLRAGRYDVVEGAGAKALEEVLAVPLTPAAAAAGGVSSDDDAVYRDPETERQLPHDKRRKSLAKAVSRLTFMVAVDTVPIRLAAMYTIGSGLRGSVRVLAQHIVRGASQLLLAGIAEVKATAPAVHARDKLAEGCAEPVLAYVSDRFDAIAEHAYAQLLGPLAEEIIGGMSALAMRLLLPRVKRFSGALAIHEALAGKLAGSRTTRSWFGAVLGASASTLWLEAPQVVVLSHTLMSVIRFFSADRFPLTKRRAMHAAEPVPAVMAWWFAAPAFLAARSGTLVMKALAANTSSQEATIGASGGMATPTIAASSASKAPSATRGSTASSKSTESVEENPVAIEADLKRWMATGMIGDESVASKGLKPLTSAAILTPNQQAERAVDDFNVRGVSIGVLTGMLEYRVEKMKHAAAAQNLATLRLSRDVAISHVEAALVAAAV